MDGEKTSGRYTLEIDLSVLDHLGVNLYSNVPAVMTELVANAWDADAHEVRILIDLDNDRITVTDDGHGMTADDINRKFLTVGFRRRADGSTKTPENRPVMGRKGVGKLAPFSIAGALEVYSAKDADKCGLRMTIDGIRLANKANHKYFPEELDGSDLIPTKGTLLVLSKLKNERIKRANLRQRLARRFSVIGSKDFRVFIDDAEVTAEDRGDLNVLQYAWGIGPWTKPSYCNAKRIGQLKDREQGWNEKWVVRGWLGTSRVPKALENAAGNLNGIVVIANGRLFQENILGEINDGRHYTKYLTGQIEADFLDDSNEADIATSDRQRVIEDDIRYVALLAFLKSRLNELEGDWSKWRTEDDPEQVKTQYPAVKAWIEGLDKQYQKPAERMIGVIERMTVEQDQREEVLKHAIFGFERIKLKGLADKLVGALESTGPAEVIKLFSDQEAMEASLYRDLVESRLEAVRVLSEAVKKNEKEKVLQNILFDKLWLLDPSWERASGTEEIEKQFKTLFPPADDGDDDADEASLGRFDISYRTAAGKHIIVELKRAGRKVSLSELASQGMKYVDELDRLLIKHGRVAPPNTAAIEVVFVIGDPVPEQIHNHSRYESMMSAVRPGSRICSYEELITQALDQYRDYLERTKTVDNLAKLLESLGGAGN